MNIELDSQYSVALVDCNNFMAPLYSPNVTAIIQASGIDATAQKYTIRSVLNLYLFAGFLKGFFQPLRGIASLNTNILARLFCGLSSWSKSGLSKANRRIPYVVFKEIYECLSPLVQSELSFPRIEDKFGDFKIFDATYLQLALKLVPWAKIQNPKPNKGQMLMSIRIDDGGMVPEAINLDSNPTHCETHFEALIDWMKRGITYLFDRGYRTIETLVKIHRSGNFFITRWNQSVSLVVMSNLLFCPQRKGEIEITRDQKVRLGKGKKKAGCLFRLITFISYEEKDPQTFYILTNRLDLCPFDAVAIYRYRWQIEIFFKWLKNSLKINHLWTHSENGVYSQIYITLILNLLLAIYHKNHNLNVCFGINTQRQCFNYIINLAILWGMELQKYNQNLNQSLCKIDSNLLIPLKTKT